MPLKATFPSTYSAAAPSTILFRTEGVSTIWITTSATAHTANTEKSTIIVIFANFLRPVLFWCIRSFYFGGANILKYSQIRKGRREKPAGL